MGHGHLGRDGSSLKARAIVFALAAGAFAFILSLLPGLGRVGQADGALHALIPAIVVAAMCWAASERMIAATAGAIDAAIDRLSRAARGDLTSAIPHEVGACVPELSIAMRELFAQLNETLESIETSALIDSVTGLPNRNHFRGRCEMLVAEVRAGAAALLFIDLDRFKAVNDTLGHAAGDGLLAQVAQRLRTVAGEQAPADGKLPLIGRLAGDEFTIFLPRIEAVEDAARLGEAIVAALAVPFEVNGHAVEIGASIGAALYPAHGGNLNELMKAADSAMYQAKANGRSRVELFNAGLAERLAARAVLDQELREAIAGDQFALLFQPQVATRDGRAVAAEVLLRWRHPSQGLTLPDAFIRRAEENGAIVEIGDWVIDTVAATLARWERAGIAQRLAINVSQRQLDHAGFFRRLHAALVAAGAPAGRLELELSETLAMACSPEVLAALAGLRRAGVTIGIDDFGTGFSNLAKLRAMPLDRIKLDPSVVADVVEDPRSRTIVQALVALIHGLDCEAVAVGVETPAQADVLRVIGCDVVQGHGIASPMDEAAFLAWVGPVQPSARVSSAA